MAELATLPKPEVKPVEPQVVKQSEAPLVNPAEKTMAGDIMIGLEKGEDPDKLVRSILSGGEEGAKAREPFLQQEGETEEQWTARLSKKTEPTSPETEAPDDNLEVSEKAYVDTNKAKWDGLETRYKDEKTDYPYVQQQITEFANKAGLQQERALELSDRSFGEESKQIVLTRVQEHVDRLLNSEQGRLNPEKHKIVSDETQRYLELVSQAQTEGDLPTDLSAQDVLDLATQNVWSLAFQDRVASENLLGDHGVRHLVGHNIRATELIDDELVRNGQQVKAIDRLIKHQTMIDHDIGYAMDPVREQVNSGNFKADRGHNVLAAKFERQRAENQTDVLSKVYSRKQIAMIHEGILDHDGSSVNFDTHGKDNQARKDNINSAIHVADNTHAFEDKLPELLYGNPDTLRIMRLMKTAGEIGDQESFQSLQSQLVDGIKNNSGFSKDDKDALIQAAGAINKDSYKFSIGRICGNKPEYSMDQQGNLSISVQESAIHQDVVGLYGQDSYAQLRKFVGDLTGNKDVDLNQDTIRSTNGKLEIKVKIGDERAGITERTDYQKRIEEMIKDPSFQEFIIGGVENRGDVRLSTYQLSLEQELKNHSEGSEMYNTVTSRLQEVKNRRRDNLRKYLEHK